jgi:hypothetical protein
MQAYRQSITLCIFTSCIAATCIVDIYNVISGVSTSEMLISTIAIAELRYPLYEFLLNDIHNGTVDPQRGLSVYFALHSRVTPRLHK